MGNIATFLQYILKKENKSIFTTNAWNLVKYPKKESVLAQLLINLSYEEIRHVHKSEFKKNVRNLVEKLAFSQLIKKKSLKKRESEITYGEKPKIADYLLPNSILKLEEQRYIF